MKLKTSLSYVPGK